MPGTTAVFVHGFISSPDCWNPFMEQIEKDPVWASEGFRFARFQYPTEFVEWNPTKRIPTVQECGNLLGTFLDTRCRDAERLILVGHSMGGLVIQSLLAEKIRAQQGASLARIRSVVLFATPNRGSTILSGLRGIFARLRSNPQEEDLRVLDKDVAEINDVIVRNVLAAKAVDNVNCPIPFRVFWGAQDDIVPEVSARGAFVEASCLPGGHSEVLQCDPANPQDLRYLALKDALLNPVGHPSIHEVDLFEVHLTVSPASPDATFVLSDLAAPLSIHTDNVAHRLVTITFSPQNRCRAPYEQKYRSEQGFVELLGLTEPNEAPEDVKSEYFSTGKRFSYIFTPDREGTFVMKLRIYNGFASGQRNWHNHMNPQTHYRRIRLTLTLTDYRDAGYQLSPEPHLYFHRQNIMDHKLCSNRVFESPLEPLPSTDAWQRTWELRDVQGGVIDLAWDVTKPA
jgi:pimeloyl-ACP methyl ester carboxylesterase